MAWTLNCGKLEKYTCINIIIDKALNPYGRFFMFLFASQIETENTEDAIFVQGDHSNW